MALVKGPRGAGLVDIVSGSFGAGHDAAAREIAGRFEERGYLTRTWDVVDLFPLGVGRLLRAAYLQAHLSVNRGPDSCRAVVEKLGGFTAGSVTGAEAERIKAHLHGCPSCRATQDELRDVCSSLRAHAGASLEMRFLPPAIRECLNRGA